MAFVPYVSDIDKWKHHFVTMSEQNSKQKDFYAVKPKKSGSGEAQVVYVSPTAQDVERAKSELIYKNNRSEIPIHLPSRDRRSNINNKKRKNDSI